MKMLVTAGTPPFQSNNGYTTEVWLLPDFVKGVENRTILMKIDLKMITHGKCRRRYRPHSNSDRCHHSFFIGKNSIQSDQHFARAEAGQDNDEWQRRVEVSIRRYRCY